MPIIESRINPRSQDYTDNARAMQAQLDDLSQQLARTALGGSASRSFGGLQAHTARLDVVNDDGSFSVATVPFATAASMGGASPNGTPAQWATAWTDSLMSVSHKADGELHLRTILRRFFAPRLDRNAQLAAPLGERPIPLFFEAHRQELHPRSRQDLSRRPGRGAVTTQRVVKRATGQRPVYGLRRRSSFPVGNSAPPPCTLASSLTFSTRC